MSRFRWIHFTAGIALGCGSGAQSATPYAPGDVSVIGTGEHGDALESGASCEGDQCATLDEYCDDKPAGDIIVGEDGEVVDVLCYKQSVNVDEVTTDEVDSVHAENNTVVVLDDVDDGLDVTDDIIITGNNAVIYGHGPDVSVVGGTLQIKKNNAIVRGIRIQGDVAITKNNTKLAFCEIDGDLTITGNNTTVAECTVHGKLTIRGQNTILVQNSIQGADAISGFNLECNGNMGFDDSGDAAADAGTNSWPIECVDAEGKPAPQSDVELDAGL